jgi:hypothetical protein
MNDWYWQQSEEDRRMAIAAGDRLADGLSSGWRPPEMRAPFHLGPNESCFSQENTEVLQYLEGDGTYTHTSASGSGAIGVALVVGSMIGNHARRQRAASEAAPRFRVVDGGRMYLTNRRFSVQGQHQWIDLWFEDIRMSSCDGASVNLTMGSIPAVALRVWPAPYHFALFRWLAHGEIVRSSGSVPPAQPIPPAQPWLPPTLGPGSGEV